MNTARLVHVTVHGIGVPRRRLEDGEGDTWVTVDQFEAVLDAAVGRPHVRVTFDDGNDSDLEIALPRLLERGLTASFFVLAGLLGEPGRLDADGVRELSRAGMTIGSHGWVHRDWRTLGTSGVPSSPAHEELVLAPQTLRDLTGADVGQAAVPFGSYDRHVIAELRRTGATAVFTSDGGWARSGAWLQPRNSIRADSAPDWAELIMRRPPALPRRARTLAARTVKRLRGSEESPELRYA